MGLAHQGNMVRSKALIQVRKLQKEWTTLINGHVTKEDRLPKALTRHDSSSLYSITWHEPTCLISHWVTSTLFNWPYLVNHAVRSSDLQLIFFMRKCRRCPCIKPINERVSGLGYGPKETISTGLSPLIKVLVYLSPFTALSSIYSCIALSPFLRCSS